MASRTARTTRAGGEPVAATAAPALAASAVIGFALAGLKRAVHRPPRRRGRPAADFSASAEILQGAAIAFGRKGYADTSVEDILAEARVSRRTFYRFFRSKDDVFERLFDVASSLFLESIRIAANSASDAFEKAERCVDAYLQVPLTAGPIYRVFYVEAMRPGTRLEARRQQVMDTLMALLDEEAIRARRGRIDPLLIRGLVAAMESIALHLIVEGRRAPADLDRAKRAMLRIFLATLAREGEEPPPIPLLPD